MTHPYKNLPARNYWRRSVANKHASEISGLFTPRFPLHDDDQIAVGGSCFAQHLKRFLERSGVPIMDVESAPASQCRRLFDPDAFSYGVYSARYGNIYTARQLVQLAEEALNNTPLVEEEVVWPFKDRFVDALRPTIEPDGFATPEEVMAHRQYHLSRVRQLLRRANVFIFTLGLTEAWRHRETGRVYPIAPGVSGGVFDEAEYEFVNFTYEEVVADLKKFLRLFRRSNPEKRVMFTVSPVPLAATYEDRNVLVSTVYSKSVLRAAAGAMQAQDDLVDYFPSYEIIAGPNARASFYESDMRNVHKSGVEIVMEYFRGAYPDLFANVTAKSGAIEDDAIHCEEVLLGG